MVCAPDRIIPAVFGCRSYPLNRICGACFAVVRQAHAKFHFWSLTTVGRFTILSMGMSSRIVFVIAEGRGQFVPREVASQNVFNHYMNGHSEASLVHGYALHRPGRNRPGGKRD